jgi:hypothetical protein
MTVIKNLGRHTWPINTYHQIIIINFTFTFSKPYLFQPSLLLSFIFMAPEGVLSGLPISGQLLAHCS